MVTLRTRVQNSLLVLSLLIGTGHPQQAKLAILSTTYDRAQVVTWLDKSVFAVSRWDGSLGVFRRPGQGEYGPVMIFDASAPSLKPIQMITPASPDLFVTSNDEHSLALWKKEKDGYKAVATAAYEEKLGTANSGAAFALAGKSWLVTGHEHGSIIVWTVNPSGLHLQKVYSVQSPDPIPSPYHLKNVRGVAYWRDGAVVTGSEDGDIVLFDVVKGSMIARDRYNPGAQRGINAISISGDYLVVANCSVGNDDKNLWLFQISRSGFKLLDSTNLKKNLQLPQVFDFSTQLLSIGAQLYFVASTEEGLLWLGSIDQQHLKTIDNAQVSPSGGAAIAVNSDGHEIASVAFDIQLIDVATPKQ